MGCRAKELWLSAGGAALAAERPPGIRLGQLSDKVCDLGETHDPTLPMWRRTIRRVDVGGGGCGARKPPGVTEPPAHRPYRRDDGITPRPRGTQLEDHATRMFTCGKPSFSLSAKRRPRIGPGTCPGHLPTLGDAPKVRRDRQPVPGGESPGRMPHPGKLPRKHPPFAPALVLVASMLLAQHDAHPVRQVVGCDTPTVGPCTQHAHRQTHRPPPRNPIC